MDAFDRLFHTARDAYPHGSPEAIELQDFVPKFARFRASQPEPRASSENQRALARALDLPTTYDARYKVNVSVSTAPTSHLARAADGRLPPQAIEEYRRMLSVYEDFYQKRQLAGKGKSCSGSLCE